MGRVVVSAFVGHRLLAQIEQGVGSNQLSLCLGTFQGCLQAGLRQVIGGGVGFDTLEPHREHRALIVIE